MQDRFIVPQFIDAEDRIWGPVTVRQFVIVLVGGLFEFIAYKAADFALFIFESIIILGLVGLFAFYKVNGRPFHVFFLNVIQTLRKPRIRVWKKDLEKKPEAKEKKEKGDDFIVPKKNFVTSKKLSELSLIVDTGGAYKGEREANELNNMQYEKKKDIF